MSERTTATTESDAGTVTFETISCANADCGSDVVTEDAVPVFAGGRVRARREWAHMYEVDWENRRDVIECAFCPACAESLFGITEQHGIPGWIGSRARQLDPVPALLLGFLVGMATFMLVLVVVEVTERYQAICEACGESSSDTGVSELVAEGWQADHASQHDALEDDADPEIRIVEVGDE